MVEVKLKSQMHPSKNYYEDSHIKMYLKIIIFVVAFLGIDGMDDIDKTRESKASRAPV